MSMSLQADEAFLEHFQLDHDPFAARVPGFKFFPAQRKSVLGQLHHLARYSQLLLAVVGPSGSGKTLLRQALVASANKQTVQCVVLSGKDSCSLRAQFAQGIGARASDLAAIQAQVVQLGLMGQEVYLLVDDADQLADEALATLLAIAQGSAEGRPHVFLFAEISLVPRIEHLCLGEERVHVIELQPYDEAETREYLGVRLQGAGRDIDLFSDEQIEGIHQQSGGWPGLINEVARQFLVDLADAERQGERRAGFAWAMPRRHLIALGVVVAAVIAAWFMQDRPGQALPPAGSVELGAQNAGRPVLGVTEGPESIEVRSQVSRPATPPGPVLRQPLAEAAGGVDDGALDTYALPSEPSAGISPAVSAAEPVVAAPVPEVISAPQAPAPAPMPAPAPVQAPASIPRQVAAPVAKPAPAQAAVTGGSAAWYRAQAAGHYTLQLFGTRSEQGAKALVAQHGSGYRYFSKQHQGKPLYVVTYGSFSSRSSAQAAVASLPAKLRAEKPWPKNFGSIQAEMSR